MPRSAKRFKYAWPRPALTVDLVLLTRQTQPRVLLIRRRDDPFAGAWAFPGGFVEEGEGLEAAARRELMEEASIKVGKLVQLGAYADPNRDPRGWTITVAFLGRVVPKQLAPKAGDDASEAAWHFLDELPTLAFDHADILKAAVQFLKKRSDR